MLSRDQCSPLRSHVSRRRPPPICHNLRSALASSATRSTIEFCNSEHTRVLKRDYAQYNVMAQKRRTRLLTEISHNGAVRIHCIEEYFKFSARRVQKWQTEFCPAQWEIRSHPAETPFASIQKRYLIVAVKRIAHHRIYYYPPPLTRTPTS